MKRFSETATRAALANGATIRDNAHYTLNAGYRVHIDGEQAGYITSDLFGKLLRDGTITASFHGYGYTEYMTPDQITAARDAAAAELAAITTPGTIELRARRACTIGARRVRDGEHFLVTVYGDGTQASPANAYGKLYDFRTADHAHLFAIVNRPEPEQDAAQDVTTDDQGDAADEEQPAAWQPAPGRVAVKDANTDEIIEGSPRALYYALQFRYRRDRYDGEPVAAWEPVNEGAAAVIAAAIAATERDQGAALDAAPAEEATEILPVQQPTSYIRADGDEATHSATKALSWHRAGHDVIVARHGDRSVYVHGAPQEAPREEDENRDHCRRIAEEIDAYAAGEYKRCPGCGEIHRRNWDTIADVFRCPECGSVGSVDDWETLSLWEYFNDAFDIEYRVAGRARDALRSVRVMVACGGPNIYVDTASRAVELYWWGERASYPVSYDAAEIIDEWATELWCCL